MPEKKGVSLNPADAVAGGLLDDVTVTVKSARFVTWDYDGKSTVGAVPALKLELVQESGDESEQYFSVGAAKDWEPSADGKELVAIGTATALRSKSNFMIFMQSLLNAQFPSDKVGSDITVLDGLVAHVIRVAAPKRTGLNAPVKEGGREATILCVDKIIKLPWEKKAAGKKAESKAAGSAVAPADDEVKSAAIGAILELIAEGPIPKKNIPAKVMQIRKAHPQRNAILSLVYNDTFLSAPDAPWTFADGIVSPA